MNFSAQQLRIFKFIEGSLKAILGRGKGANLVVKANAGTGKTVTMVSECIRLLKCFPILKTEKSKSKDICFLAFNRSIAGEIDAKPIDFEKVSMNGEWTTNEAGEVFHNGEKMEGYKVDEDGIIHNSEGKKVEIKWMNDIADVYTTHKFGMRCINRYLHYKNAGFSLTSDNVDDNDVKYIRLAKALLTDPKMTKAEKNEMAKSANTIFNMCRINLVKAGDIAAMKKIIEHYDISATNEEIALANTMMIKYAYNADVIENPFINYTDMLIFSLVLHKRFEESKPKDCKKSVIPYYRVVFWDECQDLNAAQRTLMSLAARDNMFVAVGDPNQAINGFAGANNDSFDRIAALPNTYQLPLSVNYRCGKNIIKQAQTIVPEIQASEDAEDGIVRAITALDVNTFEEGHYEERVDEETGEITNEFVEGDMVLARCTAPLVSLCIKFIAQGKAAHVMGRDIVKSIESMVRRSETKTVKGFVTWAEDEKKRIVKDIMKKRDCNEVDAQRTPTYITFCDMVDCILAFSDEESSLEVILEKLDKIFAAKKEKDAITFCTCHKSKGLENHRVFILTPERLPMTWKDQLDWQYDQEVNLKYVAITRAKHELVWVNIEQARLMAIDFNQNKR
jgi:superfamily I DNA/RNA helicase